MAQLSTEPVVFCRVCGEPLIVRAQTFVGGQNDELLLQLMVQTAANFALCDFHREQRNRYIQENRLDEWEDGNL